MWCTIRRNTTSLHGREAIIGTACKFLRHASLSTTTTLDIKERPTPKLKPKRKQSVQHDSLESFIHHTSIQKSDLSSTVYRGTLFEYTVLDALTLLNFKLHRTGGADDKGVDLRGTWALPGSPPITVMIQCKHEAKKIGPKYIRELCGISSDSQDETVMMLASTSTYTPKALQFFMASHRPICLFVIDSFDHGGAMRQLIWNSAADKALSGLEVRAFHDKEEIRLRVMYKNKLLSLRKS